MGHIWLAASTPAGLLDINGTFWIELVAFVMMMLILGRYAYPRVMEAGEARQRQLAQQLQAADAARAEAEEHAHEATRRLEAARTQAADLLESAGRDAERIRAALL